MYDLFDERLYTYKPWSLGSKADSFGKYPVSYSSATKGFENRTLSDCHISSYNDTSKILTQRLKAKAETLNWGDVLIARNVDTKVSSTRHSTVSDTGSELQYSSFVDDVLSQSSERSSVYKYKETDAYKLKMSATEWKKSKTLINSNSDRKSYSAPPLHRRNNSATMSGDVVRSTSMGKYSGQSLRSLRHNKPVYGASKYGKLADKSDFHRRIYSDFSELDFWIGLPDGNKAVKKGIVNLDKNQLTQLEDENDKLRKKVSEFQRENIKLKEDFNELKIYNDKAQQTIKDLKSCLEDARSERGQLVAEIKKLKDQGMNNTVSSIVNHYIEKGLYEDAEKDSPSKSRSRSQTPVKFNSQPRSTSPTFTKPVTPARSSSPVRFFEPTYSSTYTPVSRSQTPTPVSFNFDEISPAVDGDDHEIYPHRRTRSYVQKYGSQNDGPASQVDLNDPEIQEFLKPKSKLTYDLDLNENDNSPLAKRKLLYSPYMDKDFVPRSGQNDVKKDNNYKTEKYEMLPKKIEPPSQRKSSIEEEWESRKFIAALDHAVMQTPAQIAQQRFLQDLTSSGNEDTGRWKSPAKGILKNTKSAQNMSIKESISPNRRSLESRSYSPAIRSPLTFTGNKSRSFTPDSRSYGQTSPARSYSAGTRSYSPNNRSRSQSPRTMSQRSYSPGYRTGSMKDSGYSTPTQQSRYQSGDNRDYGRPRTPVSARTQAELKKGLLSEEERRYADLLIDKYTRQQFIGIPLASS
ncbi:hypothetical protein ACF0H5_001125 [Mactra antiquata]